MHQLKIVTRLMLAAAIVLTIGCDRVTKHIAAETMAGAPERTYLGDTLRLAYVENSGGFLGLGSDLAPTARTQVFTVGTGVLLLALIAAAFKLPWHPWSLLGIAFFVAGGASNWIDRVVRGSVARLRSNNPPRNWSSARVRQAGRDRVSRLVGSSRRGTSW